MGYCGPECYASCSKSAGWVIHSSQRNSHYRLSIIYSREEDSDTFTCTGAGGGSNSLEVVVTHLACPALTAQHVRTNTTSRAIGGSRSKAI